MHILLIHQNFAALDEPGGTRHHELARYLVQKGHQVTVITSPISYLTGSSRTQKRRPEPDGVRIIRPYVYRAFHRSFFHRVLSFLSFMVSSLMAGLLVRDVDLVWGTSPPIFQGATAWSLARLKRAPFAFEVRDLWPAFAVAVGVLRNPLLIRPAEMFERFLYRRADRVIVNSPGFTEHVKAGGARQVDVVPNGADPRMFDPLEDGSEFRRQHNLEGKFVAMYAGAHGLSNDLGLILEAAALLRDSPDIQFVLVGDGKEKDSLMAEAAAKGMTNISFLPAIPKVEIGQAFAAADACIAILKPVKMYETVYPNKVFDYMAAGKPVVLAIGGVIQDVVQAAKAGMIVAPGNPDEMAQAVRYLAGRPQESRAMGLRGRQYIEDHFDRAALAARLESIFVKMAAKRNKV
jgi:glycosyltransferase involved in cell wall biosynthesis